MFTVISRIIHYGLKNFVRNGLLSTATVAIVTLSLIVFLGLILTNGATNGMIAFLEDKIDITVYFKTSTSEDDILSMKSSIEKLSEVRLVEYVSADKALELFRAKHEAENDQTIIQSLNELNVNPLEPSFNIKAYDPSEYAAIASYLEAPDLKGRISTVSYAKNQVVIDRLIGIIGGVNRAGLAATIILSVIAGLVVFNTIRLVIYSNRDEIGIMRAVGASNALVRGPYVIEGTIIGVLAAILSLFVVLLMFLLAPLVFSSGSYFDFSIPGFSLKDYFYGKLPALLAYQILLGVGITGISSFIAVRRYLKN
ncbi:MAG: permease-like cell division protein FtsX [Patescibacteria group bacterium]